MATAKITNTILSGNVGDWNDEVAAANSFRDFLVQEFEAATESVNAEIAIDIRVERASGYGGDRLTISSSDSDIESEIEACRLNEVEARAFETWVNSYRQ
jgi:cellulase/cellobiase CelA1